MKLIVLTFYIAIFVATPVIAFRYMVAPALGQLEHTYANADSIASRIAHGE